MRNGFSLFASTAAILVLGLGLALKADRYSPAKTPDFKSFEAMVETRMQAHGWQNVAAAPTDFDTAYRTLTFRHAACRTALNILVLGYTSDLGPLLRARFGDDLTYIQDGRPVETFDTRALQFDNLRNALARSLRLTKVATPPLAALAPTPETITRSCPQSRLPKTSQLFEPAPEWREPTVDPPTPQQMQSKQ